MSSCNRSSMSSIMCHIAFAFGAHLQQVSFLMSLEKHLHLCHAYALVSFHTKCQWGRKISLCQTIRKMNGKSKSIMTAFDIVVHLLESLGKGPVD